MPKIRYLPPNDFWYQLWDQVKVYDGKNESVLYAYG
jgi:hypothetical protein